MSERPPIRQEPEGIAFGAIARGSAIAVLITVASLGIVYAVLASRGEIGSGGAQRSPDYARRAPSRTPAAELDSYGWVDRRKGIARIPIRRAMELIAERER